MGRGEGTPVVGETRWLGSGVDTARRLRSPGIYANSPQNHKTTGPRDNRTTDYSQAGSAKGVAHSAYTGLRTTRLQDHKTTGPQDHGTTDYSQVRGAWRKDQLAASRAQCPISNVEYPTSKFSDSITQELKGLNRRAE